MKTRFLTLTLVVSALFITSFSLGKNLDDNYVLEHLNKKSYDIDPDAAAVILNEKATVNIYRTTNKYIKKFTVHTRVKILKASAFRLGNIKHYYYDDNTYIGNVSGTTYNLDNNNIVKNSLAKSAVYYRDLGDNGSELSFAMPAIKEGSVIEYTYEIISDMSLLMPEWFFQNEFPTLRSEYELVYPYRYQFMTIIQSTLPFKNYSSVNDINVDNPLAYKVTNNKYTTKEGYILWGRRDIPAAREEPYISSLSNYIERLDIQLSAYADAGSLSGIEHLFNDWKKFTKDLLDWESLGKPLKEKKEYINERVSALTKNTTSDIEKAKAIFNYCRSSFQCTDTIAIGTDQKLKTVYTNKQGNAAEINILLISMLKKAGLNAVPVVLSTLGHLKTDDMYPMINRFNHLVCMLTTGSGRYLLDASNKYNSFGTLPYYCYNGYARIVDEDAADSIYIQSKTLTERSIRKVAISNITDTSLDVEATLIQGMIESRHTRQLIDGDEKNKNDYINKTVLHTSDGNTLQSYAFENLDNPDTNVVIHYTLHRRFKKPVNTLYLNTDYIKFFEESPFISMKRQLPVELPFQMDYIYTMNVQLPVGYKMEGTPEPAKVTFGDNDISFRHMISANENVHLLTVTTRLTTQKTFFPVNNYEVLRTFFEKIINETNQVITLKKS